jgi:hypothetical protein
LDTPPCHRHQRQRNHQRCTNSSSRSVALQWALLVIECVALHPDLYEAILDVCEFVLAHPGRAQSRSSALTTAEGVRFRLAVPGHHPYKVFWSSDGPRIEAVFPYH